MGDADEPLYEPQAPRVVARVTASAAAVALATARAPG